MRDRSKVLVELGRIAYIAAATRVVQAQRACDRARENQDVKEAELEECRASRNMLADALGSGGQARNLQHLLDHDHRLADRSQHQSTRLDQATEHHAETRQRLAERRGETQWELARLRLAEKLLRSKRRSRSQQRERRQLED